MSGDDVPQTSLAAGDVVLLAELSGKLTWLFQRTCDDGSPAVPSILRSTTMPVRLWIRHHVPPAPVYQPEMLGEAIFLVGTTKRREWTVGEQSVGVRIANQLAPQVLDALTGAAAVKLQQTTRENVAARRDPNTFKPSTRASGMHGPFDRESLPASLQWWITKRSAPVRAALVSASLGFIALGVLGHLRPRR